MCVCVCVNVCLEIVCVRLCVCESVCFWLSERTSMWLRFYAYRYFSFVSARLCSRRYKSACMYSEMRSMGTITRARLVQES